VKKMDEVKILARQAPWSDRIELLVTMTNEQGRWCGRQIEFTTYAPGVIPYPTITLTKQEAQILIDQLWDCGLRPSEGSGSAGQLAAVQRHLEDMRTLVFEKRTGGQP